MDIKIFTYGGMQGALSVQKNEKITRTVPIIKSNFQTFYLIFFLQWIFKIFLTVGPSGDL